LILVAFGAENPVDRDHHANRPAAAIMKEEPGYEHDYAHQEQILLIMICCCGCAIMVSINRILGPKRPTKIKGEAFECGNPPSGSAWGRFSVRFYLTAICFWSSTSR